MTQSDLRGFFSVEKTLKCKERGVGGAGEKLGSLRPNQNQQILFQK